ncbi:MAG: DUF3418 domain-containing protein, partial [Rubripirellula sp.]
GLRVNGNEVSTDLFPDLATAEASIRNGVAKLFAIAEQKELRGQVRWLPDLESNKVKLSGFVAAGNLETSLMELLARIAFVEKQPLVRTRDAFNDRREGRSARIAMATQEVATWLTNLSDSSFAVRKQLEGLGRSERFAAVAADVRSQLDWLLAEDFLSLTPWEWFKHYPRYLRAIDYRLDKIRSGSGSRDAESMRVISGLWGTWLERVPESQRTPQYQSESEFRWMIEELRVSLFAQPLGTSVKVSAQRCEKLLK